jgi:hypothetical protein
VITEHESHTSPQTLVRQHESKLGVETLIPLEVEPWPKQALGKRIEEHRGVVEEKNLRITQEVPPWHGEAVLAWPRWHQARGRRRHHVDKAPHPPAPGLAEEKAKQLEIKLEVAMAEIQSVGGDRDESTRG